MSNARFIEVAAGFTCEALADRVVIQWDPISDTANINFETGMYLKSEDEYIAKTHAGSNVSITAEDMVGRSYSIGGVTITGAHVNMFARLLYDEVYNETYAPEAQDEDE